MTHLTITRSLDRVGREIYKLPAGTLLFTINPATYTGTVSLLDKDRLFLRELHDRYSEELLAEAIARFKAHTTQQNENAQS